MRILLSLILAAGTLTAQTPKAPKLTPEQEKATADIREFFRRKVAKIAEADLAEVKTLADWQRLKPVYREQLFEMLGLSPRPEKTDLKVTVTGTLEKDGIVVEKLHFQSRPGLYVTANFWRPAKVDKPLPTILYVCGHGNERSPDKKLSYGAKTKYQHHAAWFAREGYCCLIIDTLQLAEIEGQHHGTYRLNQWWWPARGYTPAGVEAWNCIRALDYLETRPEVDAKKIGVTGRSGGGIYTWWLAALDDRPACLVPVAGITDLQNYVVDRAIEGHCDCMFMHNLYAWDFSRVAALAAPRPVLFSNSDKDKLFPLDGVQRCHAKLRRIYGLHDAADKLGLLITEGPHSDTQELQVPAFRWMNRWLKGVDTPITRVADKLFEPKQLVVFDKLPADQVNTTIQETFVPKAEVPVPKTLKEWETQRVALLKQLKEKSFRNWPADGAPLGVKVVQDFIRGGMRYRVVEFSSEENLRLSIYIMNAASVTEFRKITFHCIDDAGSEGFQTFQSVFIPPAVKPKLDGEQSKPEDKPYPLLYIYRENAWLQVIFLPRGSGSNQWDVNSRPNIAIRRSFSLMGRTLEDCQVWDARRALQVLAELKEFKTLQYEFEGSIPMAILTGMFESNVGSIRCEDSSVKKNRDPHFLHFHRVMDLPQAAALMFPRKVFIPNGKPSDWDWTMNVAKLYDAKNPPLQFKLEK